MIQEKIWGVVEVDGKRHPACRFCSRKLTDLEAGSGEWTVELVIKALFAYGVHVQAEHPEHYEWFKSKWGPIPSNPAGSSV